MKRRLSGGLAFVLSGALVAGALTAPAQAAVKPKPHLSAQQEKLDADGAPAKGRARPDRPVRSADLAAPVWPAPGKASVELPATSPGARAATAPTTRAGNLPVTVGRATGAAGAGTRSVSVELLDRAAVPEQWRDGLLLRVGGQATTTASARTAGPATAQVSVDYRAFKNAYGANWSSRLKLWRVPECALSTPERAGCSATPLTSRNEGGSVSAEVPLPASVSGARTTAAASTLVALAAGASGTQGDLAATPLSVSSTWSAGTSTGGFSWSYPMRVPPSIGGPAPSLGLAYSSDTVDGQSDASNSQPSWIGEGFDFWPGYIERGYVGCSDDMTGGNNSTNRTGDQCWRSENATMSLNGRGTELVYEAGKGWHGRTEDGSKIEKLTGATNGDNNGEYWKVTTTDGTQYFFGMHNLPGQSAVTDSAWTVPVAGNQSGEPCYNTSFASSFCDQAWRWNLDYVVDPRGNTMSYWYTPEGNYYARNATSTSKANYDRGGTLKRIDYGTWDRGATDRSVNPTAQVLFTVADRCDASCSIHDAAHWKDVPWDQECTSAAANCGENYAPTFWSTKRLSKITTQVWDTTKATPAWQPVESWTLNHSWPAVGDGSDHAGMWLTSIVRAGLVGGTDTMPPVTFEPVSLPNRVLTKNNTTNNRMRMGNIVTETGSKIQVTYSLPDCTSGNLPATTYGNTRRCYPVITPDPYDYDGPEITEWWHKYVVTQVSESDLMVVVGGTDHGQPVQNTFYSYLGGAAWHYADDNGMIKPRRKTWNQFRGYAQVETRKGDAPAQTLSRTTFLRGMHGDKASTTGGTRNVTVGASLGSETVYDEDQFAGMVREQVVYDGDTSRPVSKTVNVPWRSSALATRTINGDTVTSRWTNTRVSYTGTALGVNGAGGWRVTSTESTFDDTYGTTVSAQDNGDLAKTGDEKCYTYSFNRNTGKNLTQLVKRTTAVALKCGVAPTSTADVLADEQKFYDGATSPDTAPSYGAVTRVDKLKDWSAAAGTVWQTVSKATFDTFGRPATATDDRNNTATTTYTPASGGPVTRVTTSSPDPNGGTTPWTTSIDQLPYWGSPSRTTDYNGRVSDMEYDPSGRLARGWEIGWAKVDHPTSPSVQHSYVFAANRDAYPYVKSSKLNAGGGYLTSYQIFDAFLRPRQSQAAAVGGGRVVTDTLYDKAGRAVTSYQPHVEPGTAAGGLWWEPEWSVPALTRTVYDNASRATDQIFFGTDGVTNLVEKWRTTTQYLGDSTRVTPPAGGTVTTAKTDAQGRTVELLQRVDPTQVKPDLSTKYSYNRKDQLERVTDSLGNEWVNAYDVKGRQITAKDPDKGTTTTEYNDYDEPSKTTDANGKVLLNEYDSIGRRTGLYEGSIAAANKRAEWTYDKLYTGQTVRGQLTQSTRYEATSGTTYAYTNRVTGFNTRYQPTGTQYVIPTVEGNGLSGTFGYGMGYSPYTGDPTSLTYPAGGGLTTETVTTGYDATTGLPTSLNTNLINVGSYVIGQQYTAYGEPSLTTRKTNGGVYVEDATYYDLTSRRVDRYKVQPETAAGTVQDTTYQYQDIGNITSIKDAPQVGAADAQCFGYDGLRRLTRAWTPKAGVDCATAPSVANLGGPAPYWYDWSVDDVGNRRTETAHTTLGDTVRTYTSPTSGKDVVRPHAVTSVATQAPGQSAVTTKYGYDNAGNMACRPASAAANDCATGSNSQVLSWNSEGRLASVTAAGQSLETNIYDAGGTRLIRRDATGTTLYLPGQEIRRATNTVLTGTRYYSFAGATVATRNSTGLTWLYSDHQGTQQVGIDAAGQQVTVRRQTPYGDPRGTQPQWSNSKGFVGGDKDPTGLTHIGAREYDPGLGRFVSVDPIQDLADPQQWNAYAYSNNSPISFADPTGLKACSDDACGPGADYEDLYGNYVEVKGDNDGCGGSCGDKEWAEARAAHDAGNGNGGGSNAGKGGGGKGGGGKTGPSDEDIKRAKEVKKQNAISIIIKAGGQLLLDFFGINDILDCIHGDLGACAWTLVGMLPWGKALQMAKKIKPIANTLAKGARALMKWSDDVKWADDVLQQAESCLIKHSFAAGTKVLMANGDKEPIEKLKVGDEVLATDPETGATEPRPVTKTHTNNDVDLTDLTVLVEGGGESVLKTTQHHPFWSADRQEWVDAADLRVGERLRALDGSEVAVKSVRSYSGAEVMHDLTVADMHTYNVVSGRATVLVHNCGGTIPNHLDTCECATGGPMRVKLDPPKRVPEIGTARTRAGDETAADAGKADKRSKDAVKAIDGVGKMSTSSVPNPPQLASSADPNASLGGALVACAICVRVIWRKISGK
ncbi:polymorphic toxin-type HINT domain-containing protein [Micromonospora mirobrigensis]|uniref:polymorphic toxin-type HINT domain-containing protein n=1 Tax=Micromonospora mirobrigensis TaxID=262898 RepID=UPI00114D1409|nr:polymorphic toxin-type HINT domain-containing protein [Micromonospora mirobrigensis]